MVSGLKWFVDWSDHYQWIGVVSGVERSVGRSGQWTRVDSRLE